MIAENNKDKDAEILITDTIFFLLCTFNCFPSPALAFYPFDLIQISGKNFKGV